MLVCIIYCVFIFYSILWGSSCPCMAVAASTIRESLSNNPDRYSLGCAPVNMTYQAEGK